MPACSMATSSPAWGPARTKSVARARGADGGASGSAGTLSVVGVGILVSAILPTLAPCLAAVRHSMAQHAHEHIACRSNASACRNLGCPCCGLPRGDCLGLTSKSDATVTVGDWRDWHLATLRHARRSPGARYAGRAGSKRSCCQRPPSMWRLWTRGARRHVAQSQRTQPRVSTAHLVGAQRTSRYLDGPGG